MPKNFRRIPPKIQNKLKKIAGDDVIVGVVRRFDPVAVATGAYIHLGLPLPPVPAVQRSEVLPEAVRGKHSKRNVEGEEIVRKDLPKETHYTYIRSPNWGNPSKGYHTTALPYQKYPRDFLPPRNSVLIVEPIAGKPDIFRVTVSEVIKKNDRERLLDCLNLLQENVGSVDVFPADVNFATYLGTLAVGWEILPPGQRDQLLKKLSQGRPPMSVEKQGIIEDRATFFDSLKPIHILVGTSGMNRYMGAQLADNLVVFENTEYGNAVYIMYEGWADLSQRSRVDLLSGRFGQNFDRIIHSVGWKDAVKAIVAEKRK